MKVLPDGRICVVHCWSDEDSFVKGAFITRKAAYDCLTEDGYTKQDDVLERDLWFHDEFYYNAEVQEFEAIA